MNVYHLYGATTFLRTFTSKTSESGKNDHGGILGRNHLEKSQKKFRYYANANVYNLSCLSPAELENGSNQSKFANTVFSALLRPGLHPQPTVLALSRQSSKEGLIMRTGNSKEACLPHPEGAGGAGLQPEASLKQGALCEFQACQWTHVTSMGGWWEGMKASQSNTVLVVRGEGRLMKTRLRACLFEMSYQIRSICSFKTHKYPQIPLKAAFPCLLKEKIHVISAVAFIFNLINIFFNEPK